MNRPKTVSVLLTLVMTASALALPPDQVPRKSPEFTISQPSGKTTLLSSFKSKVVVIEFLFVKSQHCGRVAQTLNRLQAELGPQGFQSVGVAFDAPDPRQTGGEGLATMVRYLNLSYPVGYASAAQVDAYLGRSGNELVSIPQLVVIDRTGTIRAATGGRPNASLEDEGSLRALIGSLLNEGVPPGPSTK